VKKVSVITINKNNDKGLERTINSVIWQTFKNYEFIVIDGGSDDNSLAVIKRYVKYITFWSSEPDNGIYHAMNKGIAKATGEYIICMNSGDCFFSDDVLSKVFNEEQNKDILAGTGIKENEFGNKLIHPPDEITFYELATYPMCHQSLFIKKNLFKELGGYDENLQISSDWKFYLLAILKYEKTVEIIDVIVASIEPAGISSQKRFDEIISKERKDVLKKYFPYFYPDYVSLRKKRRFTWRNIKVGLLYRLNRFFNK